ncbi:putative 5'-3' exoribonuclease (XRN2) [Babesia divergens]|uniref:5'-3' exoribonuclease (XRN2) n=1 Tax=Babesia divergens TaxID=32595 RepID=A0AAD9GEY5_BABDI|nr:putative 5'-3' exoribonuclease (XRN2) [Babesia divergens]
MGVPGFFRWLAQRYPLICETYRGSAAEKDDAFRLLRTLEREDTFGVSNQDLEAPDGFDNLYLDVNGIIHNCSHSIEDLCQGIRSEEDIFVLIFQYINNLVRIVQPRKLLYLAIDGVAPMAKIIQQRDRRFRSARDRKKSEVVFKALTERNEAVEPVEPASEPVFKFDAIQITPGTSFMQRLTIRLQFFAHMMIHENAFWRHLKIVVSGSDVPGEGEHKIMEYIRNDKAERHAAALMGNSPVYLSHCIYGLDADLIMLSLATHEPYVCLLREHVYFYNKQMQSRLMINMDDYVFMHVGVLREYIVNDLIQLPDLRKKPDTIDRVVDDFVFITMFMGNDFLPHGKFSKIPDGGINAYISLYSKYITERYNEDNNSDFWLMTGCGEINYDNLLRFLGMLVKRECNRINDEISGGPDGGNKPAGRRGRSEVTNDITVIDVENMCISKDPSEFKSKYGQRPKTVAEWKSRYYLAKMGIANDIIVHRARDENHSMYTPPSSVGDVVRDYLEAIQWVLYYYYRGVPSWSWFLRSKYAPLISDVFMFLKRAKSTMYKSLAGKNVAKVMMTVSQVLGITFELSAPITPFEQLMMVLPPAASYLLPSIFSGLMTDPESPLRRYYPEDFDVDMDDTNVQWGGVTLLPVVPHDKLLWFMNGLLLSDGTARFEARIMPDRFLHYMESLLLTEAEKSRNGVGLARIYFFNSRSEGKVIESPLERFGNIPQCKVDYMPFFNPSLRPGQVFPNKLMMPRGLLRDRTEDHNQRKSNVWFPSLSMLPYIPFSRGGVQVFHSKSHFPSVYLWVRQPVNRLAVRNLMNAARAKYVVVGYPYQHIGRLESIHTPYITMQDGTLSMGNPHALKAFVTEIRQSLEKKGIVLSHRPPDATLPYNKDWAKMSSQILIKLLEGLPGCSLSPKLPSVRQAMFAGLDHVSENVVVKYRMLDINLQDTSHTGKALLPFVRFVDHIKECVPQMKRNVFRDTAPRDYDVALSNNLNEMIALRNAIRQHELLYGRYSKPQIKAICIMAGSLYGCVGTIDTVGNSFDEITAVFQVPDFRTTIAESAQQRFMQFTRISTTIEGRSSIKWHNFHEICNLTKISPMTAIALFYSVTLGHYREDICMHLAHWDDKQRLVMCLPGYTRIKDDDTVARGPLSTMDLVNMVEYSEHVIDLINSYRENFPELFKYLDDNVKLHDSGKDLQGHHVPLDRLFPQEPEEVLEYKKGQLVNYVATQAFRRLKLTPGNYTCLTQMEIEAISQIYDEDAAPARDDVRSNFKLLRVSHMKNLHIPSYTTGSIFVREEDVYLGQCVVYINHNESIPLGTRGTVVGIYPQHSDGSNKMFEILLERTFVGAHQLFGRCGNMRGIFVGISDILPMYHDRIIDPAHSLAVNQAYDRTNGSYISYV